MCLTQPYQTESGHNETSHTTDFDLQWFQFWGLYTGCMLQGWYRLFYWFFGKERII